MSNKYDRSKNNFKYNKKKTRQKYAMVQKRKPLKPESVVPYQDESKKVVDTPPRIHQQPIHELKRLYYSPAICNCCWSKDNKWYRRHHRVIKKKGNNKDNRSGHWKRRLLMRPPSYMSKYMSFETRSLRD